MILVPSTAPAGCFSLQHIYWVIVMDASLTPLLSSCCLEMLWRSSCSVWFSRAHVSNRERELSTSEWIFLSKGNKWMLLPSPGHSLIFSGQSTCWGLTLIISAECNQNHWGKCWHLDEKTENRSGQKRGTKTKAYVCSLSIISWCVPLTVQLHHKRQSLLDFS